MKPAARELLDRIYATGKVEDAEGATRDALPAGLPREHAEELARLVVEEGAVRTLETGTPSETALPRLGAEGLELDFALVDGLHLFDHTLVDFFYADRMLRDGGLVVFHDTWMPAVAQAVAYVEANRAYERVRAGDAAMAVLRRTGGDERAWDFHRDFAPRRGFRQRRRGGS